MKAKAKQQATAAPATPVRYSVDIRSGHIISVELLERLEKEGARFPALRSMLGNGTGAHTPVPANLEQFAARAFRGVLPGSTQAIESTMRLDFPTANPLVHWCNSERKKRFPEEPKQ